MPGGHFRKRAWASLGKAKFVTTLSREWVAPGSFVVATDTASADADYDNGSSSV